MRLLIVTQVVDDAHPVLGFFCRWISSFASEVDSIEVVTLEKGNFSLPDNVTVHSLGKELQVSSRLVYAYRYWSLLWRLRNRYDVVLTHMNPEYTIAGFPLWFILRKQVGMWYAHGAVTIRLRLATLLANHIFTSTAQGFRLNTRKCSFVGQGIDVDLFSLIKKQSEDTLQLVTVGRLSPVKNIDTLLQCCHILHSQGVVFRFIVIGSAVTASEKEYAQKMKALAEELGLSKYVSFVGSLRQEELPASLAAADIFIHDGQTGSLDKAILEAMAVGVPVVSSNVAYIDMVQGSDSDFSYAAGNPKELVAKVQQYCALSLVTKERIIATNRDLVVRDHSLASFVKKIISQY